MVNVASSTGDHVDLCIPSATTDYARMEIAVSSIAIMLTYGDIIDLNFEKSSTLIYKYRVQPKYKRIGGSFEFELGA